MNEEKAPLLVLTFARRGEEAAVSEAVGLARATGRRVVAVGTGTSAPVLEHAGIPDIIRYGDGHGARSVVREVRARRAEEAAIVYSGPGYGGHLKLEFLALASGARVIHRVIADGGADRVGRGAMLRSVVLKAARAILTVAAAGSMCGLAFVCLRVSQLLGGRRAGRA